MATLEELKLDYEKWVSLHQELRRRLYQRAQLDLPLFVRPRDQPREERPATEEEVATWKADADKAVAAVQRELSALTQSRLDEIIALFSRAVSDDLLLSIAELIEARASCRYMEAIELAPDVLQRVLTELGPAAKALREKHRGEPT